jgi:6,7-dimethyl-8-ribityllumazine synthase
VSVRIIEGTPAGAGLQVAVIVSRYNDFVTERLLAGTRDTLLERGVSPDAITVIRVPGAYEIPLACQRAAQTGRYAAVIALGCLIRGATAHFEYIASAVAHALAAAAASTGVPIAFGVLTTNSAEEAIERAAAGPSNKGREAALAALEMATLLPAIDVAGAPR